MKKSVLMTGCSTGIGAAAAKVFSDHGWNVAATMHNPAQCKALLTLPGVKVLALEVTDKTSIDAAVQQTLREFGGIDSSGSLGEAIYAAVTDDSKKTCYGVGADAVALLAMRRQAGDEAFGVELVKRFGLDKPRQAAYRAHKIAA
jgi:NAD(P)-dependent dehydrogenase (short-subunit alcohol dehydrogenase family)